MEQNELRKEFLKTTVYTKKADGIRYATKNNWNAQGLTPKADAKPLTVSYLGEPSYQLFSEVDTEVYDALKEQKRNARIKELNKQRDEAFNAYKAGKVTKEQFNKSDEELAKKIAEL